MAAGKNPVLRYSIIDHCLSSRQQRYWTAQDLIEKFADYDLKVEWRTLMYDLNNMRTDEQLAYQAPIAYCRTHKGYYYTDEEYTIEGMRLSESDLMGLSFVIGIAEQFEGTAMLQQARSTLHKLKKSKTAPKGSLNSAASFTATVPQPYYKGLRYLSVLSEAIFQRQVLRVTYQKFQTEKSGHHIFHPYQLKTYNNRWYVRGYSEKRREVIVLGLERIEDVRVEKIRYREDHYAEEKEYFFHTLGISKGSGPVENIELEFTPAQGHYIKTLHLHHTQQILKDDANCLIIQLQLVQNYELYQLIHSFMDQVKVLKPDSLRQHIQATIKNMAARYAVRNKKK
jgi:predicted DNA-binding transcriptional regulator YafY